MIRLMMMMSIMMMVMMAMELGSDGDLSRKNPTEDFPELWKWPQKGKKTKRQKDKKAKRQKDKKTKIPH